MTRAFFRRRLTTGADVKAAPWIRNISRGGWWSSNSPIAPSMMMSQAKDAAPAVQ